MAKTVKKTKSKSDAEQFAALQNRPTKHFCQSPKCPTPKQPILLKDLQPAGEPRKPMRMYHKACYKAM